MQTTIINPKNDRGPEIENVLSELKPGYKVQIRRVQPLFCDGTLTTIEYDPDEPISMEDIRQRFGGRKLNIKVLDPNNVYVASKTISFPDPPKDDGIELIMLPDGNPMRKDRYEEQKALTKEMIGELPRAAQSTDHNMDLLKTILNIQAEQNKTNLNLLQSRVNHLETLLENRSGRAVEPNASGFDGIKDTVRMIKEMEQLRAVMIAQNPTTEMASSPWGGALEKILEFAFERERAKMESAQIARTVPELPKPQKTLLPIEELVSQVKTRLQNLPPETKVEYIKQVLGQDYNEDFEEDEDDENDDLEEEENPACNDSDAAVKLSLLSEEDRAELGTNGGDRRP